MRAVVSFSSLVRSTVGIPCPFRRPSMLDSIFAKFAEKAPVAVMMRALLENVLAPQRLDALFENVAQRQYTRELTFSAVVAVLADVVVKIQPSVNQAYRARREKLKVAVKSVYEDRKS